MSLIGTTSNPKLPPKSSTLFNNSSLNFAQSQGQLSSPTSKLHQYFASSQFLSSQEQLSVFIENFPIIEIESSHKSINEILPLLILQNELLGKKCQTQVMLIKESFSKQQAANKQNKKVKQEVESVQSQCRQIIKQKEQQVIQGIRSVETLNGRLSVYNEFIIAQNSIIKSLLSGEFKKCQELTSSRSIRLNYEDFLNLSKECEVIKAQSIVPLQQLQKYCKQSRRRHKCYSRVESSVQQFCHRLVKISTIVPAQVLAKELGHECTQFLDLIGELIANGDGKRRREQSLSMGGRDSNNKHERYQKQREREEERQKHHENFKLSSVNSDSSLMSKLQQQHHRDNNNPTHLQSLMGQQQTIFLRQGNSSSFDTLISAYIADTTKKHSQVMAQLQAQLQETRQQLSTSKEYFQSYLINAKFQYENDKRLAEEQITLKDEMIRHFEEELEKCFGLKQELENRVEVMSKEYENMKVQHDPLVSEIEERKNQIQRKEHDITKLNDLLLKKQHFHTQQLSHKQLQFEQSVQKLQAKFKVSEQEHQKQLQKQTITIREKEEQVTLLKNEIRGLKQLVEDNNVEIARVTKRLHAIEQDQVKILQKKVQSVETETAQTKRQNKLLQVALQQKQKLLQQQTHEILLHSTYVKELESQIQKKDEAIEKLNKKLSQTEMEKKSSLKLIENNQKLQMQLKESTQELRKMYEENSGLKRLVKEMRKQLEEVSTTIGGLKSIEKERERLLIESQKSERWKEQIMKDYDEIKYEILKVEAENKNLALQLKHYRNALKRIEMIK